MSQRITSPKVGYKVIDLLEGSKKLLKCIGQTKAKGNQVTKIKTDKAMSLKDS